MERTAEIRHRGFATGMPRRKRLFDLVVTVLAAPLWITAVAVGALAIFVTSGWPMFYVSRRRVFADRVRRVVKFRAMVKNAERVANRATVPVSSQRFLNLPIDSPLYTAIGRLIERCSLTEIPQFFQVLGGMMSVVGNRPLPENVVKCLTEEFPGAEERFATPAGVCGPTQLVGRENLADDDRLRLEIAYCRRCLRSYSPWLDLRILLGTLGRCLRLSRALSVDEVHALIDADLMPEEAKAAIFVPVENLDRSG